MKRPGFHEPATSTGGREMFNGPAAEAMERNLTQGKIGRLEEANAALTAEVARLTQELGILQAQNEKLIRDLIGQGLHNSLRAQRPKQVM